MKIHILDRVLEYENDSNAFKKLALEIDKLTKDSNLIFSHLVIDEVEVYDDFRGYILNNLKNIKEVIVIVKTIREISNDSLVSTIDYINRAIPEIDILSNEFYKIPSNNSWNKLVDLIEGFKWIIDTFIIIDTNKELKEIVNNYKGWNLYAKNIYSLKELLIEFEEAIKNSDYISIADILSYEILPLFEGMKKKLEKLVLEEVEI